MNQNKVFYLQIILLVILVGFFIYFYMHKGKDSFGKILDNANMRLDSIDMQIKKSRDIISTTNTKLDSIHASIGLLKIKQSESNIRVADNNDKMLSDLKIKYNELKKYKTDYETMKKERDMISLKLDSLADIIGDK